MTQGCTREGLGDYPAGCFRLPGPFAPYPGAPGLVPGPSTAGKTV